MKFSLIGENTVISGGYKIPKTHIKDSIKNCLKRLLRKINFSSNSSKFIGQYGSIHHTNLLSGDNTASGKGKQSREFSSVNCHSS
jgi:hypothetical protein